MKTVKEVEYKINKGAMAMAIGMSLLLTACGGGGGGGEATPPAPGVVATPSTITIAENTTGTFDVVLNTEPTADVSISVNSSDLSEATIDISSLTFTNSTGTSPWNVPQTVTVSGVSDDTADGNQNINIVLGAPATADTAYSALAISNVATTVSDIDAAGFTVSATTLSTAENGVAVNYTVVLNTVPDGDVVIDVTSANINEGTVAPAALTFNSLNWNTPQTVTVTPVDDFIIDGNLTYDVTMVVNTGSTTDITGYAALTLTPVAVTNSDNDAAGFTVSATTLSTTENGFSESYTVVLNTEPDGNVVVNVASSDLSEGTVAPATLTFDAINWNTPQTVTVTRVDDFIIDGAQLYDVTMVVDAINSLDTTGYAALTLTPIAVTNNDNDYIGLNISVLNVNTVENGGFVSYTIALNTVPDGDVVLNLSTMDFSVWPNMASDEFTVSPAIMTFTTVDWSTPQTVTVTPLDDLVVDGTVLNYILTAVDVVNTPDSTGYASLTTHYLTEYNADDDVVEGTLASPRVLAFGVDLAKSGGVDTTASYYQLTGLTAGVTYRVSVTGMTDDVGLSVYDDSGQTSFLCNDLNAGTVDKACDATPTGTSLWINVDGSLTTAGATYTLKVAVPPLVPSYSSLNTPLALVDINNSGIEEGTGTITDTLTATLAPVSLTQVEVLVDLTHTYDDDLVITLISPVGTRVLLSGRNGGVFENYTNTTFSDSAATAITAGSAPFSGWYIPQEALSILNLEDGNGTWSLEIVDVYTGADTGDLLNWGIKLQ